MQFLTEFSGLFPETHNLVKNLKSIKKKRQKLKKSKIKNEVKFYHKLHKKLLRKDKDYKKIF